MRYVHAYNNADGESHFVERRTTRPGDLYLFEDTEGRGHLSMNAGDADLVIAIARVE